MKKKLMAVMLVAGGSLFAQTRFFGWGTVRRTALLSAGPSGSRSGSDRLPASVPGPRLYLGGRIL